MPMGMELEVTTPTFFPLLINEGALPTLMKSSSPVYRSTISISRVAKFSAADRRIRTELMVLRAVSRSKPVLSRFSSSRTAAWLSLQAFSPTPIPSLRATSSLPSLRVAIVKLSPQTSSLPTWAAPLIT